MRFRDPEPPLDLLYRAFEIRFGDHPFPCSLIEIREDGNLLVRFSPPIPAWKYVNKSLTHDIETGVILLGGTKKVPNDNASIAAENDDGKLVILDKGEVGVAGEEPPWAGIPFWEPRPMWGDTPRLRQPKSKEANKN